MDVELWNVVLYGFFLGWVGMNIGGLLAYLMGRGEPQILHLFVFMMIGALYTIVFGQILPESLHIGGFRMTIGGFLIGAIFAFWLESTSHHLHFSPASEQWETFMKSGLLLSIAIGIHNFPSGIALGSVLTQTPSLADGLSIALMLHNIPEGIALGLPLVMAKIRFGSFLLISTMVAIPIGLGAISGLIFGQVIPGAVSLMLSFSIGTILYVTFAEIFLPVWIQEERKGLSILSLVAGCIFAYLFFALLHHLPHPH